MSSFTSRETLITNCSTDIRYWQFCSEHLLGNYSLWFGSYLRSLAEDLGHFCSFCSCYCCAWPNFKTEMHFCFRNCLEWTDAAEDQEDNHVWEDDWDDDNIEDDFSQQLRYLAKLPFQNE